jgi:hypothetical protein
VADNADSHIYKVTEAGTFTPYTSAVTQPVAVAFNTAGALYVSDAGQSGRIVSFRGNGNSTSTLISNLGGVRGLAFDTANTAYYVTDAGELRKVTGSNTTEPIAGNLGNVQLLTARAASVADIAYKGKLVTVANNAEAPISTLTPAAIGAGQLAFKGVLTVGGTVSAANALALFRANALGDLQIAARKSFPAPGMQAPPGTNVVPILNNFGDPIMNNAGRFAFTGTLLAGVGGITSANSIAIFSDYDGGALRPVLQKGQASLGNGLDPAVKFVAFRQLVLPDDAGPAVIATMAGPGVIASTATGLWAVDISGNLSLVLRAGTSIDFGNGKVRKIASLGMFTPTPLSLGQARHFGNNHTFVLTAKFSDGFAAILRVKPGSNPEVLVTKGGEVGNAVPGAKIGTFGSPAMAENGDFAYRAVMLPLANVVTAATAPIIFAYATENTRVARVGDSEPDIQGAIFSSVSDPVMSTDGGLAFLGKLKPSFGPVTTATSAGLWQDIGAGFHNAVRQGSSAPDVPGSTTFTAFKQFVLPATGGVAFTALIAGSGITTANNVGIWANDGFGATDLLLRKGDKITVGGKSRTVTSFKVFTPALGVTGQSRNFDEAGTITVYAKFSDLSQAVLAVRRP